MKPTLEINSFSILIDRSVLESQQTINTFAKGILPVLKSPFKLELVDIIWEFQNEDQWPRKFYIKVRGEIEDRDWNVLSKIELISVCPINQDIIRWGNGSPFGSFKLQLGTKSKFYINNHEVDLTSSINKILNTEGLFESIISHSRINSQLKRLSNKIFGSDLLQSLMTDIYYQFTGNFQRNFAKIGLSAGYDTDHFSKIKEVPPYIFLSIPTTDLEYFVKNNRGSRIEIKGYELSLKTIEVISDNKLIIKIKELIKNWDIDLSVTLELRDNKLCPIVEDIQVIGLDFLKRTLFKAFKGLLVNQIEKHPVSFQEIFNKVGSTFNQKYPFLKILPELTPSLDVINLTKEKTEILVHFNSVRDIT